MNARLMFSVLYILDQRVSKFYATNSTRTFKIPFLQNKTANLSGATPKRQLMSNEASSLNNCLVFHMCVIACWPQCDNCCACTDMSTGLVILSCDRLSHSENTLTVLVLSSYRVMYTNAQPRPCFTRYSNVAHVELGLCHTLDLRGSPLLPRCHSISF